MRKKDAKIHKNGRQGDSFWVRVENEQQGLLWRGDEISVRVFPGSASAQVAAAHKLLVVHAPPRPKVILVTYKAFMERQIGAYCVLCREGGFEGRQGQGVRGMYAKKQSNIHPKNKHKEQQRTFIKEGRNNNNK